MKGNLCFLQSEWKRWFQGEWGGLGEGGFVKFGVRRSVFQPNFGRMWELLATGCLAITVVTACDDVRRLKGDGYLK